MKTTNITIGSNLAAGLGLVISLLLASIVTIGAQNMSGRDHARAHHAKLAQSSWNGAEKNSCDAPRPGAGRQAARQRQAMARMLVWL